MRVVDVRYWMWSQERLDGRVVLEHGEPRRDAIVKAFERAGYRQVQQASEPATVGYRDAATPSLSLGFEWGRKSNHIVKSIHVWREDARTMGYRILLAPRTWLVRGAGVLVGVLSLVAGFAGDPVHRPWVVGLMAAGVLFGMPKLWNDDLRELLRDVLEGARAADEAAEAQAVADKPKMHVEAAADEKVRVATDAPALAAAARAARDGVVRHEPDEPQDVVEELERAARRGRLGD